MQANCTQQAARTRRKTRHPPDWRVEGEWVCFPTAGPGKPRRLDGFYHPGPRKGAPLLILVHGMGSNFYRSALKKALVEAARASGLGILSFNNRGAERGTEDEAFNDCLRDVDAAVAFAKRCGHRRMVLAGHSTGCQKIVYWQARRRSRAVAGLVLLAPADDHAVLRRDLGRRLDAKVAWARRQVAAGKPLAPVTGLYERFGAARFLSVASPRSVEANVFRYEGRLTHFRRVRVPVLAVFGEAEEFAAIPPPDMLAILRRRSRSRRYEDWLVPGANHSFKGCEGDVADRVCAWACEVGR